jgi:hypothetical protein
MAFAVNRPARLSLRCLTTRQASLALRTAQLLPLKGLSTLGSGPARFQARPPACYRAPWRLPGPDFHRQATTSFRSGHDRWTITSVISGRTGWSTKSSAMQRYQPPTRGISVLDRLIVRAGDIPIWRALATQSDRNAIAEVTDVSRSKVDSFLNEHSAVVAEIEEELLLRTPPEPVPETRATLGRAARTHAHRLAPLHSFAVEHHRFFQDAEVKELIKERGDIRLTGVPHVTPRRRR